MFSLRSPLATLLLHCQRLMRLSSLVSLHVGRRTCSWLLTFSWRTVLLMTRTQAVMVNNAFRCLLVTWTCSGCQTSACQGEFCNFVSLAFFFKGIGHWFFQSLHKIYCNTSYVSAHSLLSMIDLLIVHLFLNSIYLTLCTTPQKIPFLIGL